MKTIAIRSIQSAAGATTVCANMAYGLYELGYHCVVIDLNPNNFLALHFGFSLADRRGLFSSAQQQLEKAGFSGARSRAEGSLTYVPFGQLTNNEQFMLCESLIKQPGWLKRQLAQLDLKPNTLVLLDVPYYCEALQQQAYQAATYVINVLACDARAYPAMRAFHGIYKTRQQQHQAYLLFNQVAPQLSLNTMLLDLLQTEINPDLQIPVLLQRDQHLPEALATQQCIQQYNRQAQAAADYEALALWFKLTLEQ